ncbi:Shedu immune nuclease family protein [Legionella pneumophila]|uniref:Shedu immune nuclease family protein n=1 Tax=Legionella pneumophila TaxID=446 RepID=UPI001A1DF707|nr:Shedu immune nuclease family protein [Legionella pneumophila]HAT9400688.1 DUF4263 domain-containing protein [Legionella pneumophila subsp. pneumophila]MCW8403223.1 DUF4263 domain-containing protein [Legionella pneumophila]MCZ4698742.1 DUF4263 domain-containing protein [Legionella pneumophila]MCZ4714613.1 DUF4263 domain-containing protein [Legionella pneumophila]MCZ4744807.1 DUF4263 domain-containing protein [Legionella pneumophila]
MSDKYTSKSTSLQSAQINDIELHRTSTTRKIIRPTIVENPNDSESSVKIDIIQQKCTSKDHFEDITNIRFSSYKAKEIGKLCLDSAQTRKLYDELHNLYQISKEAGVQLGETTIHLNDVSQIIQTDQRRAELIRALVQQNFSEEMLDELIEEVPDLVSNFSIARIHGLRKDALDKFSDMLNKKYNEQEWQNFFEENTWIFGYGLNYQILKDVANQPNYGGQQVDRTGQNKGDFLKSTEGAIKFTVLVEIKRPDTELLQKKSYRNDVILPSEDLIGGVSQLRANARTWELESAQSNKNRDLLESESIFTVQPKKILVIGNMKELDNRTKHENFEQFRKGQADVEILTFDEVFERAKYIVEYKDESL